MSGSLVQSMFPECPDCGSNQSVTENGLFSMHNPNRYFCEDCSNFFDA